MFHHSPAAWLAGLTVLVALGAHAQTPGPATDSEPALAAYQPFQDVKLAPWKESNDTVGRVGGWRAYAREAQGEQTPAPAAPAASGPAPGHKEHQK